MSTEFFHGKRVLRTLSVVAAIFAPLVVISTTSNRALATHDGSAASHPRPVSIEKLSTRLEFPEGTSAYVGTSRPVVAVIHNKGFDAAEDFGVYVKSPKGTTIKPKTKNWECSESTEALISKCLFNSGLDGEESVEVVFQIFNKKTAEIGVGEVVVTPFTSSKKKIESKKSPYTIIDKGDAILLPRVMHLSGKTWKEWTDGRIVTTYSNEKYTYSITVKNEGHEVLKKGARITLRQRVGTKVVLNSAVLIVGKGDCIANRKSIDCRLQADRDIKPGARLATARITITPTQETQQVELGTVTVSNPVSKAAHSTKMNLRAVDRGQSIKIGVHHQVQGEVGGTAKIFLKLQNTTSDITHKSLVLNAKLPKGISFKQVEGADWSCDQDALILSCRYASKLAPQRQSSKADILFHISDNVSPNKSGYEIDILSQFGTSRLFLTVLAPVVVKAEVFPKVMSTSRKVLGNQIRLDADETLDNGKAVKFTWVQRCTTAKDVAKFGSCPTGAPAPKVKMLHVHLPRAHAYLPHVTSKKTFVFEVVASTDSSSSRQTVKVKALPASDGAPDADTPSPLTPSTTVPTSSSSTTSSTTATSSTTSVPASSTSTTTSSTTTSSIPVSSTTTSTTTSTSSVPASSTSTTTSTSSAPASGSSTSTSVPSSATPETPGSATTPEWIASALTSAQVTVSNQVLSNGIFTANATLPAGMISRFGIPTDQEFLLTAKEAPGSDCIVVHAGDTQASIKVFKFATANMSATYFEYIIAPTPCTYEGDVFNGLGLKVHGDVFGVPLTFTGTVALEPKLRVDALASVSNLNISTETDSFGFKNVAVNLLVDDQLGIAKLSMGADFYAFDLNVNVVGNISAPTGPTGAFLEGMQVSLTTPVKQALAYDEIAVKDLSFSIGIRYTPKLAKAKPLITLGGTGTVQFMGASAEVTQMEFDFSSGQLSSVIIKVNTEIKLPSIKAARADFSYVWKAAVPGSKAGQPTKPSSMEVDLTAVFITDSGFSIGTEDSPAYLQYRSGKCITMGGKVIVPGILDAEVSGYLITGYPCFPAANIMGDVPGTRKSILSEAPVPVNPGDWRFDASNVTITLAGFKAAGNFTIGKMYGIPYGMIDALIRLTTSDTKNTLYVKGNIGSSGGVALRGEGNLEVAGVVAKFTANALVNANDQVIEATSSLKVGPANFELAGYFSMGRNVWGMPTVPSMNFSATVAELEIDGFNLGSAEVSLQQDEFSAGVTAKLNVNLGLIQLGGLATFHAVDNGLVFTIDTDAAIKVGNKWEGDLSFHMSNCGDSSCSTSGRLKVSASGHAVLAGKKFELGTINFDTSGHFNERVSYSGNSECDNTGNIADFELQGCFSYTLTAQIADSAPYLALRASVSLEVDERGRNTKKHRWGPWKSWGHFSAGIKVQFDPFELYFDLAGYKVGFTGY